MISTRQIKRRITSAKNISKITGAMEMVAASKMKKAQNQALRARPFAEALIASLKKIAGNLDPSLHPLLSTHLEGYPVLVIVSTDKGLCGSLNTNILKQVISWKNKNNDGKIIAVGKKAVHFSQLLGIPLLAQFTELPESIHIEEILPIAELVKELFLVKEANRIDIIYTDFINTLSQKPKLLTLLPVNQALDDEVNQDQIDQSPPSLADYSFEPNAKTLLNQLLPYYLENTIFHSLLEATASEHSARMVAMKNASENASELVDELKLIFNKSRQASITSELLDISTAVLTLS